VIGEASQPALSPDGRWIAFQSWKNDERGIKVMATSDYPLSGGNQRRRANYLEDGLPSWSPDGWTLVFSSRREGDRQSRVYQVGAHDGADAVLMTEGHAVYGEYPTWMPNGAIVYKAAWPDVALATMNADGSGYRPLLTDSSATAPAVSPNGQYIAFMSQRDGSWEIYRIKADGSGLARLTDNAANDGLPVWSPDGSTIAFVSDRDGTWGIWAMNADGSGPEQGLPRKLFTMPGSPDGHVRGAPDYTSRGWTDERLAWGP
jgi:TolB protein